MKNGIVVAKSPIDVSGTERITDNRIKRPTYSSNVSIIAMPIRQIATIKMTNFRRSSIGKPDLLATIIWEVTGLPV